MRTFFALSCILFLFMRSDLRARLMILAGKRGLEEWLDVEAERAARILFRLVPWITTFRIHVEPFAGPPLPRAMLIVTNHQSLADIPVLIYAFPGHSVRFVTKRELGLGIPMVSLFLRAGHHALISRKRDFGRGRRQLVKLARRAEGAHSPIVFPEGTRSRSGRLAAFQSGAFRTVLENAQMPVLSVALDGGHTISRVTGMLLHLGRTHYRVKPLALHAPPKGKRQTLELLGRIREEISAQLDDWRREE